MKKYEFKETGKDYDFIATMSNNTDKTMKLFIENEEQVLEPIIIKPQDWIGFLAEDYDRSLVENIKENKYFVEFE